MVTLMPDWLRLLLAIGLVYRVAHATALEDGPFDVFSRLQAWAGGGKNWVGRGLSCILCVSWWLAVPAVALFLWPTPLGDAVLIWGGIAGAVVVVHKVVG